MVSSWMVSMTVGEPGTSNPSNLARLGLAGRKWQIQSTHCTHINAQRNEQIYARTHTSPFACEREREHTKACTQLLWYAAWPAWSKIVKRCSLLWSNSVAWSGSFEAAAKCRVLNFLHVSSIYFACFETGTSSAAALITSSPLSLSLSLSPSTYAYRCVHSCPSMCEFAYARACVYVWMSVCVCIEV